MVWGCWNFLTFPKYPIPIALSSVLKPGFYTNCLSPQAHCLNDYFFLEQTKFLFWHTQSKYLTWGSCWVSTKNLDLIGFNFFWIHTSKYLDFYNLLSMYLKNDKRTLREVLAGQHLKTEQKKGNLPNISVVWNEPRWKVV